MRFYTHVNKVEHCFEKEEIEIHALFTEPLGRAITRPDDHVQQQEMAALADKLRPITVESSLGTFRFWEKEHRYWLEKGVCKYYLDLDEGSDLECHNALKAFEGLKDRFKELDAGIRKYLAWQYVDGANEFCQFGPLTEEQFADMLYIIRLEVHNDGTMSAYYYDAGECFYGEEILVSLDADGKITKVC